MVKITGWYQLPGDLPRQVDFEDLFDTAFMRKHTKYRSFEKFLAGGKFTSWKEMIDTATDIYARRAAGRK